MTEIGARDQVRSAQSHGDRALADDLAELGAAVKACTDPRLQEIAERYRRALADRRHFPEAVHGLGMVAMGLGKLTVAERLLRSAVESDPARIDFVGNLGNALKDLGRFDGAVACYRKVIAAAPNSEVAYNNLANTLQEQGDLDEAIACYRRAVEIKPAYAEAWTNLGNTLQKRDRSEEAVAAYGRALDAKPDNAEAWLNLGVARHRQGDIPEAIACLEKALAIRPAMVAAFNRIQRIRLEQGEYEDAKKVGRRIRELAPRNQMAVASEAFASLATDDMARFRYLYGMDGLPRAEVLEAPAGYRDLAAFNGALIEEVLSHPSLKWIHDSYDTTKRGFVYGLLDDPPPALAVFGRLLHERIEAFRTGLTPDPGHPFFGAIPERYTVKLWATILNRGGYHPPHIHENNWLGGTYYAKLPESCRAGTAGTAGAIEFDGFTDLPGLDRHGELVKRVVPLEGLLVVFPAYMLHGTLPFTDDDTRIGLSFDVTPA